MPRGDKETEELVTELERGWDAVRTQAKQNQDQLYVHKAYLDRLEAAIDRSITTVVPIGSRRVNAAADDIAGILRQSLQFHVEPQGAPLSDRGNPTKVGGRADKVELWHAHNWHTWDYGGRIMQPTRRWQATGPFAAWWIEYDAFALPRDEDARESYRKSYSPIKLSVIDATTVSAMIDDNGVPTVGARHYQLPYIDLARRYGKGKEDNPLTILNEQFGFLRGGRGQPVDTASMYTDKATVWVIDDGSTICHYIETKETGGAKYHEAYDEVPNPFGGCSLIIIPGRYNADATELVDRYEGLVSDLYREQYNLDAVDTHMASLALSPARYAQVLPADIARSVLLDGQVIPGLDFDKGVAAALGPITEIGNELPMSVREFRAARLADRDAVLPSPFLTNPSEVAVAHGTAAAQLRAFETGDNHYDSAREYQVAAIHTVCKYAECFVKEGHLNKGYKTPGYKVERIHIRINGNEPSKTYAGDRKGEELDIGPEDLDDDSVLTISPVADNQSQKALEFELGVQKLQAGIWVHDDLIATDTEDVSGKKMQLEEDATYQDLAPFFIHGAYMASIELVKLKYGMDLSMLAMAAGVIPGGGAPPAGPPPAANGSVPPAIAGGMVVNTTAPPPIESAPVEAIG